MSRKIYINESQFRSFVLSEYNIPGVLEESLNPNGSMKGLAERVKNALRKGISTGMIIAALLNSYGLNNEKAEDFVARMEQIVQKEQGEWKLIANNVIATVYNAESKQCNKDVGQTACMFRLNLKDVLSHRIIAMERTMMAKYGFNYGDLVKIEGTGKWDGVWQIRDTMNKKFKGKNKIDILIPKSAGKGLWKNIKVYKLNDDYREAEYRKDMAPQLSKKEFRIQNQKILNGTYKCI